MTGWFWHQKGCLMQRYLFCTIINPDDLGFNFQDRLGCILKLKWKVFPKWKVWRRKSPHHLPRNT